MRETLSFKADPTAGGSFLQLEGVEGNAYDFSAVFFEFGDIDVVTAGPIPPGVWDARVAMAFVDSNIYYKNKYPMKVSKVDFDSKLTVAY